MAFNWAQGADQNKQNAPYLSFNGQTYLSGAPGNYSVASPYGNIGIDNNLLSSWLGDQEGYYRDVYNNLKQATGAPQNEAQSLLAVNGNLNPGSLSFEEWFPQTEQYRQLQGAAPYEGMRQSGVMPSYEQAREGAWEQYVASQRDRPWYRSAVKTIVPAAIGLGGAALGTAAFAPGLLSGLGGAATGISAGGAYSGGLGSTLGNFATNTALSGALKGGIGGLLSGGDLSSALKGAALGGVTGGYGGALGETLGLGSLGQKALTGALTGASGGLASGNAKVAGLGALLGGGSSYIMGGGNVPGLGTVAGAPVGGGVYGPTQGSGALGAITRNVGTLGGSSFGGNNNMLGDILKGAGSLYGMGQTQDTNEEIQRLLQQAAVQQSGLINQAQDLLSPYQQAGQTANQQLAQALAAGFNPSDLATDPAYQYRLQQGEQAINRNLGSRGMSQSGAALKALQEHGQGLAAQEYENAYNRWLAQNQQLAGMGSQGLQAAGAQGNLYGSLADILGQSAGVGAATLAANNENRQKTLAELLSVGGNILGSLF